VSERGRKVLEEGKRSNGHLIKWSQNHLTNLSTSPFLWAYVSHERSSTNLAYLYLGNVLVFGSERVEGVAGWPPGYSIAKRFVFPNFFRDWSGRRSNNTVGSVRPPPLNIGIGPTHTDHRRVPKDSWPKGCGGSGHDAQKTRTHKISYTIQYTITSLQVRASFKSTTGSGFGRPSQPQYQPDIP